MSYSPIRETPRRRARYSSRRKIILIASGILVMLLLVGIYLVLFTDILQKPSEFIDLGVPPGAQVGADSKYIYVYKNDTLYCMTSTEEIWPHKFPSAALEMRVGEGFVCLFDSTYATIIDSKRATLFTLPNSTFEIVDVACGKSSVAMLSILKDTGDMYYRVFDLSGKEVHRAQVEADSQVLKFALSGPNDTLIALTLNTTGVYSLSRVVTMNPAQKTTTALISVYDQLIEDVFLNQTNVYVSGTTTLSTYDTFGKCLSNVLIYGQECVDTVATDKKLTLAYVPSSSSDNDFIQAVRLLCSDGSEMLFQLPVGVTDVVLSPTRLYCFAGDEILVYTHAGGFEKTIPVNFSVNHVQKLSPTQLLLKNQDKVYYMTMK